MLKTKLLGATAAAEALAVEDCFSCFLYTGNGSTQTITNGIDLAGEGGLVWIKQRNAAASPYTTIEFNCWHDSARGSTQYRLRSDSSQAEQLYSSGYISSFNSNGFTLDNGLVNHTSADSYTSWTFRKAPRFFDVVTYTGNGTTQNISHNLGVAPGCIIIKRTDSTSNWITHHRGSGGSNYLTLRLNETAANLFNVGSGNFTGTQFLVANWGTTTTGVANDNTNVSGGTYVAYLFAHDPLGPSGDGSDGLIACGSFTTDGSSNFGSVSLGWEPQYVLYKRASGTGGWFVVDSMRGITSGGNDPWLAPNTSSAESGTANLIDLTATGFFSNSGALAVTSDYIYIAIRRGPMRQPTSGTEVYLSSIASGVISTGFPVDFHMRAVRASADITNHNVRDRLRGGDKQLVTSGTTAETTDINLLFDSNNGLRFSFPSGQIQHFFRRAPGFFDVVAYTGTGVNRTVSHNLGVIPELMIVKRRSLTGNWGVYSSTLGATKYLYINTADGENTTTPIWNNTAPTESVFTVGTSVVVNQASSTYIAYLFATLPGISKVGSYTGNGSSQAINCGFTGGARFILIKRTDTTGDWHLFDSARGIVSGNDPYHRPNRDFAEVTTNDSIDPDSSGFIVNQVSATDLNVSSASYIFLAVS
jgi:hypothetical protein